MACFSKSRTTRSAISTGLKAWGVDTIRGIFGGGTDQGTRDAFAYVANPAYINDSLRPYHWYKEYVLRGAREFGLPGRYIDDFIESVASVEDPNARRVRENRRLLGLR